jgi:hypothetical protein
LRPPVHFQAVAIQLNNRMKITKKHACQGMQRVIIFLISLLLRRIRKGRIYRNLRNRPCLPPPFEIVSIAQQMMRNRRRRFKIQLLSTAATNSETSNTLKTTRKPQPTQNQQHVNLSEGCAPSSQCSQQHPENHLKATTNTKPTTC